MGKWCLHASSFIFDQIVIKVSGNQDRHKSSEAFDFGPLVSMAHLYVFWNEIWPWHIRLRWAIVALWATCFVCGCFFNTIFLIRISYRSTQNLKISAQVAIKLYYYYYYCNLWWSNGSMKPLVLGRTSSSVSRTKNFCACMVLYYPLSDSIMWKPQIMLKRWNNRLSRCCSYSV